MIKDMGQGGENDTTLFFGWVKRQHREAWTQLLCSSFSELPLGPCCPPRCRTSLSPAGDQRDRQQQQRRLSSGAHMLEVIPMRPHPLLDLTTLACLSPVSLIPTTLSQGSESSLFLMYKNTLLWRAGEGCIHPTLIYKAVTLTPVTTNTRLFCPWFLVQLIHKHYIS